jgi:hypothetical protein
VLTAAAGYAVIERGSPETTQVVAAERGLLGSRPLLTDQAVPDQATTIGDSALGGGSVTIRAADAATLVLALRQGVPIILNTTITPGWERAEGVDGADTSMSFVRGEHRVEVTIEIKDDLVIVGVEDSRSEQTLETIIEISANNDRPDHGADAPTTTSDTPGGTSSGAPATIVAHGGGSSLPTTTAAATPSVTDPSTASPSGTAPSTANPSETSPSGTVPPEAGPHFGRGRYGPDPDDDDDDDDPGNGDGDGDGDDQDDGG